MVNQVLLSALLGLIVGIPFGYALQRGRFCMNSAFRDLMLTRDTTIFRAYVLALLVQMAGLQLLRELGVVDVGGAPFWWGAAIVGGVIFGWGMALSGG